MVLIRNFAAAITLGLLLGSVLGGSYVAVILDAWPPTRLQIEESNERSGAAMLSQPHLWQILIPAAAGVTGALGGAFLGAWLSLGNERRKQRLEFAAQQLRELYAPLMAIEKKIRTLSELREKATNAAEPTNYPDWGQAPTTAEEVFGQMGRHQERSGDFQKVIAFYNNQFETELLPLYDEMENAFRQKMHLAEASTRMHYAAFVEYIELWKRHLSGDVPGSVLVNLGHTEKTLHPLYDDIREQFERLQRALQAADPDLREPKAV